MLVSDTRGRHRYGGVRIARRQAYRSSHRRPASAPANAPRPPIPVPCPTYAGAMTDKRPRPAALTRTAARPVRGFFGGVALLGRGFGAWAASPRLMLLGAIPALIVGLAYAALIVLLLVNIAAVTAWATPFADDWAPLWQASLRVLAGAAILVFSSLILVLTYAAVTLAIGDPFYERISRAVERRLGDAPAEPQEALWPSIARGLGNGIRLFLLTTLTAVGLLLVGLIPVVGQVAAPVLGALFGGWFLTLELTGFAFDARGLPLRERRRMLGRSRSTTLGFGVAAYLLFLIPLVTVIAMPAAVAGATLLARNALAHADP